MLLIAMVIQLLAVLSNGAFPLTPEMRTFGHAIKSGHFPSRGIETTTFEHNCSRPPCVITQLHIPTAGPHGWAEAMIRVYIDNETVPSINVTLLELAHVGALNADDGGDSSAWGIGLFGHTASRGGVYSTVRIPFSKSVRTTIESAVPQKPSARFWFIVRGIEAYHVQVRPLISSLD